MDPLLDAVAEGSLDKVKEALRRDGSKAASYGLHATTPLMLAAQLGHLAIAQHLITFGGAGLIDAKDDYGRTALHFAAEKGHTAIAQLLIRSFGGSLVFMEDSFKVTPLHLAAKEGHRDMVRCLVGQGGLSLGTSRDLCGNTPVREGRNHVMLVDLFLYHPSICLCVWPCCRYIMRWSRVMLRRCKSWSVIVVPRSWSVAMTYKKHRSI